MNNNRGIGEYIIKARKGKGMTQKQLAEKVGASLQDIRNLEHGEALPIKETMSIADILEIPYFKLLINQDQHNGPKCNVDDCKDLYTVIDQLYKKLLFNIDSLDIDEGTKEYYKQRLIYSYGIGIVEVYNKILDTWIEAKREEKRRR